MPVAQEKAAPGWWCAVSVYGWSAGPKLLACEAGRGLRWERDAGGFDRTAALGLRGFWSDCRVGTADGNGDVFAFTNEVKVVVGSFPVDADHVAEANLVGGEKIGHRIDDVAFDGALQVAGVPALSASFLHGDIAAPRGVAEEELALGGFEDALLAHSEFDIENLLELLAMERMEDDELVEAVHEFGRELAAGGFVGLARHL